MKVDLARLDGEGIALTLPPASGAADAEQVVRVRSASALGGVLEQRGGTMRLSETRAERVSLDALSLRFGTVLVEEKGEAELQTVRVELERSEAGLTLDLHLEALETTRLRIAVGTVDVSAKAALSEARLDVRSGKGGIETGAADLRDFRLVLGSVVIEAPELRARPLAVRWGEGVFELDATEVSAPALTVKAQGTTIEARSVSARSIAIRGDRVIVDGLSIERSSVELDLVRAPVDPEQAVERTHRAPETPPVLDFSVLDGLSGRIDVDLTVDVKLPVVGGRKGTHALRVPIDDGSLNFRDLEKNLSRLEDALLDFSVRGDTLVLELGLPLIPTRGLGKPLVRWQLSGDDVRLAEQKRIRLARLPFPDSANGADSQGNEGEAPASTRRSPVSLRKLVLENIQADLRLARVHERLDAVVRELTFEAFRLGGFARHEPEATSQAGRLKAQCEGLAATLRGLSVGERHLDLETVRIGIAECDLELEGFRPQRLRLVVDALAVERADHHASKRV